MSAVDGCERVHPATVGWRTDHGTPTHRNPPPLVLFVRHGQTPTTGKVLPGRAPGLHLADEGRAQAEAAAQRIAELKRVDAVYASPLERARRRPHRSRAARGLKVQTERGPPRVRLRRVDRRRAEGPDEAARVADGAALPERVPVPRRRELHRHADPHRGRHRTGCAARHPGGVVVAVSHADPIKAAVAHALGTHLDLFQRIVISTCSVTAVAYGESGPIVLTVNSTGGALAGAVVSERHRFDARRRLHRGHRGTTGPAGVLPAGPGPDRPSSA